MSEQQQPKAPGQAIARPAQDDPEIQRFARLGQWLAAAETRDPTPTEQGAAAALRLWLADQLGLPAWAASELSLVRGRLVVSVQLLRAIARRAGYAVERVELDDDHCTVRVIEMSSGEEVGRATFTMADADRAGLIKERGGWTTYPQRMLWARAAGWALRDSIPDVVLGLLVSEEADEIKRGYDTIEGEAVSVDDLRADELTEEQGESGPEGSRADE